MELEAALATVLRNKRRLAGFSQEELAHRCNIDRTYISMLERKKRKPTINIVFKMCDALDVKPSDFILEIEQLID
ncbi:MAG TPA: helix-turn-helix transcriptional regulator [Clostridiales bacterium]|nr:helix-turn-helix transcriptional regulator [Clostridiales bacterium]